MAAPTAEEPVETDTAPVYESIFPLSFASMVVASFALTVLSFTWASVLSSTQFRLICPAPEKPFVAPLPLAAMFRIVASFSARTVRDSSMSFPSLSFPSLPLRVSVAPST